MFDTNKIEEEIKHFLYIADRDEIDELIYDIVVSVIKTIYTIFNDVYTNRNNPKELNGAFNHVLNVHDKIAWSPIHNHHYYILRYYTPYLSSRLIDEIIPNTNNRFTIGSMEYYSNLYKIQYTREYRRYKFKNLI